MAKQIGLIKLQGEMGGITFYQTKDGYIAREAKPITSERFNSDPSFERARENNAEFKRAAAAGKVLRDALNNVIVGATDSRASNRMFTQMMRALKADPINDRGRRNVVDGELGFLQGFNFNETAPLTTVFKAQFSKVIDRVGGSLTIAVESFIPNHVITAPEGATHFKLTASGVEVDFETGGYVSAIAASAELLLDNNKVPALMLESLLPPGSTLPLFLTFGIEFFQEVNKKYYALKNGAFNSVTIATVNTLS